VTFEDLLDAWRKNNAINHALLALCPDETFEFKPGKGKTIRSNFVHIVGIRRAWVEESMRAQAAKIPKLDWKTATRAEIESALDVSRDLCADFLRKIEETGKPARWTAISHFGYMVAHEAHHRSQIEIALRLNGAEPEDAALYALWNWSSR
jgi:uncharacterized damage-inducible protein DinB